MPTRSLTRVTTEGFSQISGTAPRSGTITITAITPRESLYIKCGSQPDTKIWPTRQLPVSVTFADGDDFEVMAMTDMQVTYTLTLDAAR